MSALQTKIYEMIPSITQRIVWPPLRLFFYFFCSLDIVGQENLKNIKSNIIMASNHSSELDPMVILASLPFFSQYLSLFFVSREKDFYKDMGWKRVIYGGILFKMLGAHQAHVNKKNYKQSLHDHLLFLNHMKSVLIFPSGARNMNGEKPEAKGGVSFLAHETHLPVVPILIKGTEYITLNDFLLRKRKIKVIFGKPIYAKDIFNDIAKPKISSEHNDYEIATKIILEKIDSLSIFS